MCPDRTNGRRALIENLKAQNSPFSDPAGRDSTASPIHPASLTRVVNEVLDAGHIFIDAGNCVGWTLNNLVVDPPLRCHTALDMGPMGFAVGAVVGGRIGAPDEISLAVVGDGPHAESSNSTTRTMRPEDSDERNRDEVALCMATPEVSF